MSLVGQTNEDQTATAKSFSSMQTWLRRHCLKTAGLALSVRPATALGKGEEPECARVDVKNEDGYEPYAAANPAIFKKFGGRFLVRGGKFDVAEGNSRARNVIIEFPD